MVNIYCYDEKPEKNLRSDTYHCFRSFSNILFFIFPRHGS